MSSQQDKHGNNVKMYLYKHQASASSILGCRGLNQLAILEEKSILKVAPKERQVEGYVMPSDINML